jgi:hypothetical protein
MVVSQKFDLFYGGIKIIAGMNDQKKQLVGLSLANRQIIARRYRSSDAEIG